MKKKGNNLLLLGSFVALFFAAEVCAQEAKEVDVIRRSKLQGLNLNEKQSFAGVRPVQSQEKKKSNRVSYRKIGKSEENLIQMGNYVGVGRPYGKVSDNSHQLKSMEKTIKLRSESKSSDKPALNLNQGTYVGVRPEEKSAKK